MPNILPRMYGRLRQLRLRQLTSSPLDNKGNTMSTETAISDTVSDLIEAGTISVDEFEPA